MSDKHYQGAHDEMCESVAVDIGVGEMHSPCGCMERWYERELNGLHAEIDRLMQIRTIPPEADDIRPRHDLIRDIVELRKALYDQGATLRDFFAATVMQGLVNECNASAADYMRGQAMLAYKYADAMLQARTKPQVDR